MLQLIENLLMLLGVVTVLLSLVLYHRRTGERFSAGRVVKGQLSLDAREFFANRAGLYLLVMGVIIRYTNQLA